uniref:Uncharacterized protein n=1 Tax=Solanum tuberosum TaxID=4113 RepID=M0ZK09_SOLTU
MNRTPSKTITKETLHGSPVNHNILYKETRNKLKDLRSKVELLMMSMIKQLRVDCVKRMLMDTYPLTTLYDILEELVSAASETNEKGNSIIVLSSDIEAVASASH